MLIHLDFLSQASVHVVLNDFAYIILQSANMKFRVRDISRPRIWIVAHGLAYW